MHILFLTSSMQGGGAERVAALLCNAWVKQGHCVTLMPTFSGRGSCSYPLDKQVHLEFLADIVGGSTGRITRLLALRRYLSDRKPDVIVSFLPHVNVAALLAARGTGIPVIVSERNFPPLSQSDLGPITRYLRAITYKWARAVVVQTAGVERWVKSSCRGSSTIIIPNPIVFPLPSVEPYKRSENFVINNKKIVLGTGRLHSQKRFDLLITAFARIAALNPDWDLVILGEGPERTALEALRDTLQLNGRVHFPGFVGNPSDWYKRAEVYVLSSAYEGFPNTLLEAMAYGTTSVAFDVMTGPADIMDGGKIGVLLPDDNHVERLVDTLGELLQDDRKRAEQGALVARVRKKYSLERILAEWDKLLDALN